MISLLAAADGTTSSGMSAPVLLVCLIAAVLGIAGYWKTFTKAGHAGWLAIIPLVNIYILLKIAKRPGWWLVLYLIPLVNIVVHILVSIDVAKAFGKDAAFGVIALLFFPYIGYIMLGFSDAKYQG